MFILLLSFLKDNEVAAFFIFIRELEILIGKRYCVVVKKIQEIHKNKTWVSKLYSLADRRICLSAYTSFYPMYKLVFILCNKIKFPRC